MQCLIHKWDGCKCSRCGKVRDEQHAWIGCKCSRCGKEDQVWDFLDQLGKVRMNRNG